MDATVTTIANGSLSSGLSDSVHKQFLPDTGNVEYPCILVTLRGCIEELNPYSTEQDLRILPVAVHILQRESARDATAIQPWLDWQEELADLFLMNRLFELEGANWHIDIRNMTAVEARASAGPAYQQVTRSFFLRYWCTTIRIRR